ncbi:MAG TPA: class I SAM-dependent methyltransferase [Caulobacteraceae bacterium]|nr:class I SAM-dependent methyltransferase [Caulobacteraceae bacterium]
MDWTSGYVSEIDYTHGYYRELTPGLIDFALLASGHQPPRRAGMRYLELGYGQGMSVNIHAAASPGEYWGTDFNPVQAANAQTLARVSGADARLFDDSFADFAARDDVPQFDYIVLHGIWSWVSDENRQVLVDIMRDRLKVGGVVYFSFNTLPGWAAAMPLRQLMSTHMEAAGTHAQGMVSRIDAAIAFGNRLADVGAAYFRANPTAKARLDSIAGQNRNYLAHEYFNRDWTPMYFAEAHQWLTGAKLSFAAPATPLDQLLAYNFTPEQRDLLSGISYDVLRETVRDYLSNQQFRKDLYSRGARLLTNLERLDLLHDLSVVLTLDAANIPFEVEAGLGKVGMRQDIFGPVIEALSEDNYRPKRIGDLAELPKLAALPPGALVESIAVLIGAKRADVAQSPEEIELVQPRCERLNAHLIERARVSGDVTWLASPVTGGGFETGRFEQMFLAARGRGIKKPEDWARDAWAILAKQSQSLIKDGQVLQTEAENLAELTAQATQFANQRLSLMKRLMVVA